MTAQQTTEKVRTEDLVVSGSGVARDMGLWNLDHTMHRVPPPGGGGGGTQN